MANGFANALKSAVKESERRVDVATLYRIKCIKGYSEHDKKYMTRLQFCKRKVMCQNIFILRTKQFSKANTLFLT